MTRALLLLAGLSLLALTPVQAQHCGASCAVPAVVTPLVPSTPFVSTAVAVPVAVPFALFQFVSPPTVVVPVAVAASQVPAAPAQPAQDTARLDRIEAMLASLTAARGDGPPIVRRPTGTVETRPRSAAPVATRASLLQSQCAMCHTSPGRDGVDLFDAAGTYNPNVSDEEIYRSVRSNKMPKIPQKLSAAQKDLLRPQSEKEGGR